MKRHRWRTVERTIRIETRLQRPSKMCAFQHVRPPHQHPGHQQTHLTCPIFTSRSNFWYSELHMKRTLDAPFTVQAAAFAHQLALPLVHYSPNIKPQTDIDYNPRRGAQSAAKQPPASCWWRHSLLLQPARAVGKGA